MNKVCNRCGETKPIERFWRNAKMADGRLNQCSACRLAIQGPRHKKRTYKKSPEKRRRDRLAERTNHREKYLARQSVSNAKRCGTLIPQPCEVCGSSRVHAHHDDYTKRLEVRWLCHAHHVQLHKGQLS